MSDLEIRQVDPAEADDDIHVRYAIEASDAVQRGAASTVAFDPRAFRAPKDRTDVIGSFLHESICRSGGCDASGGHSSISYDRTFDGGVHYVWVAAWPQLAAELRDIAGVVAADLHYHHITRSDGGLPQRLDDDEVVTALALVLHRHCAEPALMPAGCGDPDAPVCAEAARAGSVVAWWMNDYKIAFFSGDGTALAMQDGLVERSRAKHDLFWRLIDAGGAAGLDHSEALQRALAATYAEDDTRIG